MLLLLLLHVYIGSTSGEPSVGSKDASYLQLRALGFEAYAEDRWTEAAVYFTRAIDSYWFRKKVQSVCIEQCRADSNFSDEVQTISLYLSTSTCVEKCCQKRLGEPILVEDTLVDEIFRKNQYYSIVQTCWNRVANYSGNMEAAVTFMLYNPTNVAMYNRLVDLYRVTDRDGEVIPRLEPWYNTQYRTGVMYYNKEEWGPCVYHLEGAVTHFIHSTNLCRAQCMYPYDKTVVSHKATTFISAAHEIIKNTAACRQLCYEDLPLRPLADSPYLASILEYLQFCQYQLGDIQEAADTTVAYTLLHKRNKVIQENLQVYKEFHEIEGQPRPDIAEFLNNYNLDVGLEAAKRTDNDKKGDGAMLFSSDNYYGSKGIISHRQCRSLIHLAKEAAIENDGYDLFKDKGSSPFTDFEKFSGIELSAAVKMLEEGAIEVEEVQLYIDTVTAAKTHLEDKLQLVRPLYFDYIHLVKRTALEESGRPADDLSHPVHGDNCLVQPDGSCIRTAPAFTHRDWSAIIYLNTPKQGGEFIITDKEFNAVETAKPECGTVVGFSGETLHGVTSLIEGERYAIGLWYTHDITKAVDMELLQRSVDFVVETEEEMRRNSS